MFAIFIAWVLSHFPQLECLTTAIYYEAGNQPFPGKIAVGNVIQNRVDRKHWPNTICKVVTEPGQFSFYWDDNPETLPRKKNRLENQALFESVMAAMFVMTVAPDFTRNSVFYHSTKVKPAWTERLERKVKVGDHIMYALRD